ncbi:NAD(P)-dependent oxidoreductase [Mycobacterium eburneum]|nr:mycofactocin-coupled SDR family oxidoreductase [Mycobacterium eburneum]TDH48355.1 NAD(P)-dependent oxidoreductase [Mycobacterium eburneum]
MGRVQDKVVLITGAARGQGRSHAVRLAEEGADVILFDICADIDTNAYPLASSHDLEEARREVEKTGRRAVSAEVDVRDKAALVQALEAAVAELGGRLDVVVANAGICPLGADVPVTGFADAFDVDFIGVVNTVHAALPYLGAGGSIITTGSVAGLIAALQPASGGPTGPGGQGYSFAKQMVDSYTRQLAAVLAPKSIRVNVIHPTNCNTPMLNSDPMYKQFRPDLEHPTREDALPVFPMMQAMPVPYVEPLDISHAVCFLASDESRYITGSQLKVDAGAMLKF